MIIVKVPFVKEETKGCEKAPERIFEEINKINFNERGNVIQPEEIYLEEIKIDSTKPEESNFFINKNSREIFEKHNKAIFLGGDTNINYPINLAFKKFQNNPLIIIFDSKLNCKKTEGEDYLRKLIDGELRSDHIVVLSARDFSKEENDYIRQNKISLIKMDLLQEDIFGICDLIMERARNSDGFFINIDISSIDPAFAPGTNKISPGGLSSRDLIYFIKRLMLLNNFKGASIVGINPDLDINNMTVKLGAKLVSEMI